MFKHVLCLLLVALLVPPCLCLQLCTANYSAACLPCPVACFTCTTPQSCLTCSIGYYFSSGSCLACTPNCDKCSNSAVCLVCGSPYALVNGLCSLCSISHAVSCSSVTSATSCASFYYLSNGYCLSCMLNCAVCVSAYTCSQCSSGYYLDSSVLTCNLCSTGCVTCSQYSSECLTCLNGYTLAGGICTAVPCSLPGCVYCSAVGVCAQCAPLYYSTGTACLLGSSVLCTKGAQGSLPTQCNNCSPYAYLYAKMCLPYPYIYIGNTQFYQLYLYSYSQLSVLNDLANAQYTLTQEANQEYSIPLSSSLRFSLPNYYRVLLALKYRADSDINVTLTATTASSKQREYLLLNGSRGVAEMGTLFVHSDNLEITPNGTLHLIEILLRVYQCSSGCTVCLNQQLCELCHAPAYMLNYACVPSCAPYYHFPPNRTCLNTCPSAYYPTLSDTLSDTLNNTLNNTLSNTLSNTLKYCQPCDSPCLSCLSPTLCLSCLPTYYYLNYSCLSTCPSQHYPANSLCLTCISPCSTCLSMSVCLSCAVGYWNGTLCTHICPNGQYGDALTLTCLACRFPCLYCDNSPTTCTLCSLGYALYSQQCVLRCPDRYYLDGGTCVGCQSPCYTCVNATECLSCTFNYLLSGDCVGTCPAGYYIDLTEFSCVGCASECKTCSSMIVCTSCVRGCLYSGVCLGECPSLLYYAVSVGGSCSCWECLAPCKECVNSVECVSCLSGYLSASSCVINCPLGFYPQETLQRCVNCNATFPHCLQCTPLACLKCLPPALLSNGYCVDSCPFLFYLNGHQCAKCVPPCFHCLSYSSCLSCTPPYALHATSCIIQCASREVSILVDQLLVCQACTPPCRACVTSPTNCTYCDDGYYLYGQSCILDCSGIAPLLSYFGEVSGSVCTACLSPCKTCLGASTCVSCAFGYLTTANKCEQCTAGTYPIDSVCLQCPSSCILCFEPTYCTACSLSYYLFRNACIPNATLCQDQGYYAAGSVCYPCLQPCLTCTLIATQCLSCLTGYIFHTPHLCLVECYPQEYRSGQLCLKCDNNCLACQNTPAYCSACLAPALLDLSLMSCGNSCPSNSFALGSVCSPCRYPCASCSDQTTCLSCISGVLSAGSCYFACASGFYTALDLSCRPCTPPCSECAGMSTNCTVCMANTNLFKGKCLVDCPVSYFNEVESQQCLACVGLCQSCSGYTNCTSCTNSSKSLIYYFNRQLQIGQCVAECPSRYYAANQTCLPCLPVCVTCTSGRGCLLCGNSLVQIGGSCSGSCPISMYAQRGICAPCQPPCFNCTDQVTCTACFNDSYLLVASASCVVGPVCPLGYYKIVGSMSCQIRCPPAFYNLPNRTCNAIGCDPNQFMGADMNCYSACPSGYIGNATKHCVTCLGCTSGLYFSLSTAIHLDTLYLYIHFSEVPYAYVAPTFTLTPALPFTLQTSRLLTASLPPTVATPIPIPTTVTLVLDLNYSISKLNVEVAVNNPLGTFANPLQNPTAWVYIEGYDYYDPSLASFAAFGWLALVCALVGLAHNMLALDFAQVLYLLGLINYHFPYHLASFLQGTQLAHLHGVFNGGSSSLAGADFLDNTLLNFLVLLIALGVAMLLYLFICMVRRANNYQRVVHSQETSTQGHRPTRMANLAHSIQTLLSPFSTTYLHRAVYFNYSLITLFSFVQLTHFQPDVPSLAAVISLLLGCLFPLYFLSSKPQYSFAYGRKMLMGVAIMVSERDPIYAVGTASVLNVAAVVLILTHKLEPYRYQSNFMAACEVIQLTLQIGLAFVIMTGEGLSTSSKAAVGWVILTACIALLAIYIMEGLLELAIHILHAYCSKDIRLSWLRNDAEDDLNTNTNSETISETMKDKLSTKSLQENPMPVISHEIGVVPRGEPTKQEQAPQVFYAYGQSEEDGSVGPEQKQAPQILIRCVNQFSDFDEKNQSDV